MDLFGTAGIRGPVKETVTPELALSVGRAVGREAETVVVGRDGRQSGSALAAAVEAGVESAGTRVRRLGTVPTPTLALASRGQHGVMLTASHNPPEDNGIKLFVDGVEFDGDAEARIERRVEAGVEPADWADWASADRADVLGVYRETITDYAREHGAPLEGLRVTIDCGNGMASLATPQVLRELGADVRALNANVDSHFDARGSKPTPETLTGLCDFVAEHGAVDLGIGHDGDADRIVIVDGDGEIVHEDTVLAILAEHYVRESDAADPVVLTTPNASERIDERVEAVGGRTERTGLGVLHEGIAEIRAAATDETAIVFAAEPWKHVHPELGGWIDGVASAAVFARLVAESGLDALREPVTERPYRKDPVRCPDEHKSAVMDRLETRLPEAFPDAEVSLEYGVRLSFPDGSWTLVRPSGTEPYVRVYVESEDVEEMLADVQSAVEEAVADVTQR
ncbi:phosphohexomutase domain-containing protein [Halapricum hydrolyticum]|uniref:Phosphomannomutase n=1 Tax=Halapricum hydrolyticum TaxID=2979991 RepID=A0AAE3LDZ0_9EURY|nr:phosphomannomutase [Halapricum hydrolyticum]MCU4716693.1 phosphomannomutase [Halapricum hydrolyticum]MCU4725702.1 phosphomannomutase [Halapricum hydrolyticum]